MMPDTRDELRRINLDQTTKSNISDLASLVATLLDPFQIKRTLRCPDFFLLRLHRVLVTFYSKRCIIMAMSNCIVRVVHCFKRTFSTNLFHKVRQNVSNDKKYTCRTVSLLLLEFIVYCSAK